MLTPRVRKIKQKYFDTIPQITAERLVLQTEAYKKFAGDAVPLFRAKVVNHIMENMTTLIMDDELIVGTANDKYRGANLHPEFQSSSWYISDIDDFPVRSKDPYDISPEDREKILEKIWGYEIYGETRTVDVHIRTLRQKLGKSGSLIETVRGVGYRI